MNRVDIAGVAGSNPAAPTKFLFYLQGLASTGRFAGTADMCRYPRNASETCGQSTGSLPHVCSGGVA